MSGGMVNPAYHGIDRARSPYQQLQKPITKGANPSKPTTISLNLNGIPTLSYGQIA
jgi:hypothetical protein